MLVTIIIIMCHRYSVMEPKLQSASTRCFVCLPFLWRPLNIIWPFIEIVGKPFWTEATRRDLLHLIFSHPNIQVENIRAVEVGESIDFLLTVTCTPKHHHSYHYQKEMSHACILRLPPNLLKDYYLEE